MPDSFHSSVYRIGCCVVSQLGDDPEDTVEVFDCDDDGSW